MLKQILEASEAITSVAASESASIALISKASAQVTQTSNLPLNPTHISPSHDSDLDDVPISQRMRNLLRILKNAECIEDPEDPPTSDLPQSDSPSNLFSF